MLSVAITVDPPTDYGPDAAHVISSACEEVIGDHCPLASELGPGMVIAWYAVVHPNDSALTSVIIEFRDRSADGVLIERRMLTFSARTSQRSRLASIGSVIAALAAAREGAPNPQPVSAPPAPAPALPAPPALPTNSIASPSVVVSPAGSSSPDVGLDVAALVSPALGTSASAWGGSAGAHLGLSERAFALASTRYSLHAGNPDLSWLALSAGVGTRLADRSARFNLELSGEFVFEHTHAGALRGSVADSASLNGWGGRVSIDAIWGAFRHVSGFVGLDATSTLPRVHVAVAGQEVVQAARVALAISLGVRFLP